MAVSTICTHNVATVSPETGVVSIAQEMRNSHVGAVVVTERQGADPIPVGVVTDRDIVVELVARGVDFAGITAGDLITRELVTVHEDSSIVHALADMHKGGVRRAPVINSHGVLVGLLSMDDIIEHLATQADHIAGCIRHEQSVEAQTRPETAMTR